MIAPKTYLTAACFLVLVLVCTEASACPTCKDGMHDHTAAAFAMSIMFMMSMPFCIFGGWVFAIVRMRKTVMAAGGYTETSTATPNSSEFNS